MGINFKGIELNVAGDLIPWTPKETDAFKAIIDSLAIDTVEGALTDAQIIGHHHDKMYSKTNNVLSIQVTTAGNFQIFNNLQILTMSTGATVPVDPGFLKNDASGNITGGNIIDITDIQDQLPPFFLNGFEERPDSLMSFENLTRTFTIEPLPASEYVIWSNNTKFTKGDAENINIPDVEGTVLIYFDDNGDLATTSDTSEENLFKRWALIAVISWDVTNQVQIYFGEERHGIVMSPDTTFYLHRTVGARLAHEPGFALSGFTIDTGDADIDAQFAVAGGDYYNEDILLQYTSSVPQAISPIVNAPVYFLDGSGPVFRKSTTTAFPVKPFIGGSSRLAFNLDTAGTWSQSEVANNDFVLCHIFTTNEVDEPIIAVQGQASYSILADAQDGAETELLSLAIFIPTNEIIPIATVIYQSSTGMTNTVKGAVVLNADGTEYIDWRFLRVGGAAIGTQNDHNALFNLTVGDAHPQYFKTGGRSGGQTGIGGSDASDDLTLQTTSNVTKGNYILTDLGPSGLGVVFNSAAGVLTGGNKINLVGDVTGILLVGNGGTNGTTAQQGFDNLSPMTTKGDLVTHDGTNNVRVPVGDDGQGIVADPADPNGWKWGNISGGGALSFDFRFSTSTTPAPPNGRLAYDSAGQVDATQMFVDKDTDGGADIHNILANLSVGDRLLVVRNNDTGQFQEWVIDVVTDNVAYITYDISPISDDGALFANGDRIFLAVLGASSGSVTLQNAYDNSTIPQIVTSDAKLELVLRRGTTGGDTDKAFEVQTGGSIPSFSVHGDGNSETGRTDYITYENFAASGGALEGEAFITTDSTTGQWRVELDSTSDDMRIGHDDVPGSNTLQLGSLSEDNLIDAVRILANAIKIKGPETNNTGEFDLLLDGTGGPRAFRYLTNTTTTPTPGDNQIRWNNATQSAATALFIDDDALNIGDVGLLLNNVNNTATIYISNEGKTKFQQFTISVVTDQTTYVEFTVSNIKNFGGNMSAEEVVQVVFQEGTTGGGGGFPTFQKFADELRVPQNNDFAVTAPAGSDPDPTDPGLTVLKYDDTVEEASFDQFRISAGVVNLDFVFQGWAETAPGGTANVGMKFYFREIPDNAAKPAWSAGFSFALFSVPMNIFSQTDTETVTLAALGMTANRTYQFQLTRDPGVASNLTDDWFFFLLEIGMS